MKKPPLSRRELLRVAGGALATGAFGACHTEPEAPVGSHSAGNIECLWNGHRTDALNPRGAFGPIQYVVVVMMENRSFDHYFGALSIAPGLVDAYGTPMGGEGRSDVNGLRGDEVNYDSADNAVPVFRQLKTQIGDVAHEWEDCHRQLDFYESGTAKNDGFVLQHEVDLARGGEAYCATHKYFGKNLGCPDLAAPMGFHARADLPVLYALADQYALCDNWYSSVLGPTWPNRFYLHAGTSLGIKDSSIFGGGKQTIWSLLRDACLGGTNYYCDVPFAYTVGEGAILGSTLGDGRVGGILRTFFRGPMENDYISFADDVANDDLAPFTIIDPGFSSGYDDHPPADIKLGQAFLSYVYHVLASNPVVWNKTLLIVTYDEHGSFYDHVVPPGDVPGSPQSYDERPEFRQLGMRVPAVVIGPYAKKGYVSHVQYDHCSVAATLIDRFDLAYKGNALNERVKHTAALADCMDSALTPATARPPAPVPKLELSEGQLMDFAAARFPDGQEGLARMIDSGQIPPGLDKRRDRVAHMRQLLEIGERVGAFRVKR
jgi:phospholipase C